MTSKGQNKKNDNHIRSIKQAVFLGSFKHIVKMKEEGLEPTIDPETGERRTYASNS